MCIRDSPDRAALKTAVDNCFAVDATGVACCSRGADCGAAGTTEMADWDVSLVTDMSSLFSGKGFFNADISRWDVSSVTNMLNMFYQAYAFNADISRWDVSSVIEMRHMFQNAYAFNKDISRWTTSGSACCSYRGTPNLSPWYRMFYSATAFTARYTNLPMDDRTCSDCHLRWNPSVLTRKDLSLIHI